MNFQGNTPQVALQAPSSGVRALFFPARVMSPTEVKAATENRPSQVGNWTNGKWVLCGDVKSELFAVLKAQVRESAPVRLTAFATPAGATYAVISHQLYCWAHRFVLPLYEPSVQEILIGVQKAELGYLLGNEGADDAVLLHSPLVGRDFAPLLAKAKPIPKEKFRDVIAELPWVIGAISNPAQIPTLQSEDAVTDVSVSVLLPTQAAMRFFGKSASEIQ